MKSNSRVQAELVHVKLQWPAINLHQPSGGCIKFKLNTVDMVCIIVYKWGICSLSLPA